MTYFLDDRSNSLYVGFTGARSGMTEAQKGSLRLLLSRCGLREFCHGDSVGADDEAASIAHAVAERGPAEVAYIVTHSVKTDTARAHNACTDLDIPYDGHFERNRSIVSSSQVLIACPYVNDPKKLGGGTWYTINYAKKVHKPVYIIWSDGRIEERLHEKTAKL